MTSKGRCPSADPMFGLTTLEFFCAFCKSPYELFADEVRNKHHRCSSCGRRVTDVTLARDPRYGSLLEQATSSGVSDARILGAEQVLVEEQLRKNCEEPHCKNFGSSLACPPHSMMPLAFRDLLAQYLFVMAFKFDLPRAAVMGPDVHEVGLLLQQTTADLEHEARRLGFAHARGFSAGSCKNTFCREEADCPALVDETLCRYPQLARPSLSGLGVNWHHLSRELGWQMAKDEDGQENSEIDLVMMSGLVLVE